MWRWLNSVFAPAPDRASRHQGRECSRGYQWSLQISRFWRLLKSVFAMPDTFPETVRHLGFAVFRQFVPAMRVEVLHFAKIVLREEFFDLLPESHCCNALRASPIEVRPQMLYNPAMRSPRRQASKSLSAWVQQEEQTRPGPGARASAVAASTPSLSRTFV